MLRIARSESFRPLEEHEEYFASRRKKSEVLLRELEAHGVASARGLRVLEMGCAQGFITYHLSTMTSWRMHGIELSETVETYPALKRMLRLRRGDATKTGYAAGSFDLIIVNHVIEHVPDYEGLLSEAYRLLKRGGVLYLATPNLRRSIPHPRDRWRVQRKVLFGRRRGLSVEERMEYHRGFAADELRSLLKSFRDVSCLNKEHALNGALRGLRWLLGVVPKRLYERKAQSCVFIARKG